MTKSHPDWLPELLDTNGYWDEIRQRLYDVFTSDFVTGSPRYEGLPVWHDRRKLDGDPHEEGFWHLVTMKGRDTGDRLLDTPRAKRLGWCRATVDNCNPPDVLVFDFEEGRGQLRRYLWIHECDYLVVLEKRKHGGKDKAYMLITAFYLDGPSSKRRIQKKYDGRKT
jgi:hypothetical protein